MGSRGDGRQQAELNIQYRISNIEHRSARTQELKNSKDSPDEDSGQGVAGNSNAEWGVRWEPGAGRFCLTMRPNACILQVDSRFRRFCHFLNAARSQASRRFLSPAVRWDQGWREVAGEDS